MQDAFSDILKQIKKCDLCAKQINYFTGVIQPILQVSPKAKILILGQAPGLRTLNSNRPFNDASGERLRDWLGVSETQFYDPNLFAIVPMAFCYPGKGKQGDLPPPALCAQTWHDQLLNELTSVKLTVCLGQYACNHYLGAGIPLTEQVKRYATLLPKVIALPHPSPRNRFWLQRNPWFETELLPKLKNQITMISD